MTRISSLCFALLLTSFGCDSNLADGPDADVTMDAAADAAPDGAVDAPADAAVPDAMADAAAPDAAVPDAAAPDATADAAPADATPDAACSDCGLELLRRDGCFEVGAAGEVETHRFGELGTEYATLVIDYDLDVGDWRRDLFDRTVPLNHITFGLSRVAPVSRERYILGMAPQVTPSVMSLNRRTIFFARVDLEERPAGMGYMAYTSSRAGFAWQTMTRYHVRVTLDAAGAEQVLEVSRDGSVVQTLRADIDYMNPGLTSSRWNLELGGPETDGREVSPVGWRLCDAVVHGTPL